MNPRSLATPFVLAGALFALAAAPGCDDTAGVSEKQVAELRSQSKRLEDENRALMNRLEAAERKIAGLSEDLAAVNRTAIDASTAASAATKANADSTGAATAGSAGIAGGAAAGDAHANLSERDREIAAFLDRDEGRKVLETAIKAIETKRDQERQDRMVNAMVDAFAQKANLTPQQTDSMRKIVGKSMADTRGLWEGMMRGDMSPEERQTARNDAMAKMQEIQTRTDDEVKSVLDSSQFGMYQQDVERMRNGMRGGMGGGMGGPGGGGFGGRGGR